MRGDERRRGSKGTRSHPGHLQTRTQGGGAAASPDIPRGGLASRTNIAKLRS